MDDILKDGKYKSDIISGSHGHEYQEQLGLTLFLRMREPSSKFQLAYEVKEAEKFDDIVLIDDTKKEIHFIQVKHGKVKDGNVKPIDSEALFPVKRKCSWDFALCKYVNSFLTVNQRFGAQQTGKQYANKFYIFSNKDLHTNIQQWLKIDDQQVNQILRFPQPARYLRLNPTDKAIKQLYDYVNKDMIELKDAIKDLLDHEIVIQILKNYCSPLKEVFTITQNGKCYSVSFNLKNLNFSKSKLYDLLVQDKIDMTKQVEIDQNFLIRNSKIKDLPPYVSEDEIRSFFRDSFTLLVNQPNELRPLIDCELRTWMKTWVRPDILGSLCEKDLDQVFSNLKKTFEELIKPDKNNMIDVLQQSNTQICLKQIRNTNKSLEADELQHYINRTIVYTTEKKNTPKQSACNTNLESTHKIKDIQFIEELRGKFKDRQLIVLVSDPGMGKTSLLQFVAFEKQKENDAVVFLIYFSDMVKELEKIKNITDLDGVLNILKASKVLSQENCEVIKNAPDKRTAKGYSIVLVMDGFDEIHSKYTKKVIDMLKQFELKRSIQMVISSRLHVKEELESTFKVRSMLLEPFSKDDQISYLRKMWNVQDDATSSFVTYSEILLNKFNSRTLIKLREILGLPLMMRMLAEIYSDQFKKFHEQAKAGNMQQFDFSKDVMNIVQIHEQFVRKCFHMKLKEKKNHSGDLDDPELDSLIEGYILEHQLLAMTLLDSELFQVILQHSRNKNIYDRFRKRCENESEKSLLVKVVHENVQFSHLSHAEYFVAKYVCDNIHLLKEDHVIKIFSKHEVVRRLSMIQMEGNDYFYGILSKLCQINWELALWTCESGCLSMVTYLLENFESFTPNNLAMMLQMSAKNGYYKISELLLKKKADPNEPGDNQYTALHLTAISGHDQVVDLLLKNNADVHAHAVKELTALHLAALTGYDRVITKLIAKGAKKNSRTSARQTPLQLAAFRGHTNVVDVLIAHEAEVNAVDIEQWTALHMAAQNGHALVITKLINKGAGISSIEKDGKTPLHIAVLNGHSNVVDALIDKEVDVKAVDKDQWTALHMAAQNGHAQVIAKLINKGADINSIEKVGNTPLHIAALNGHSNVVDALKAHKVDLNAVGEHKYTALHMAADSGHNLVINRLIAYGADMNSRTIDGSTALHVAALKGHTNIVNALIDHKVDVNAVDYKQWTALHWAAQNGYDLMTNLLIKKGAKINSKAIDGITPLHLAALNGHKNVVDALIAHEVDVNAVDVEQWTALHRAAQNGHDQVISKLIANGANINSRTIYGHTPLFMATVNGHENIVNVLKVKNAVY